VAGKLTDRQLRFCEEYLVDLNATQAAIRAGYSERTAYSSGQRLLKKVEVAEQIRQMKEQRSRRTQITQDFVLNERMKIASADGSDFVSIGPGNRIRLVPTAELGADQRAALAGIRKMGNGFEVKTYDKLKALEMLGMHLGLFDRNRGADEAALRKLDQLLEGIDRAAEQ